jgi:uncharacterized iron-regulated membrane protein
VTGILRRVLFWMHLTVAISAGVVIVIMSATGVVLAYQRPAMAMVAARHRVVPPSPHAARLPLDTIAAHMTAAPDTATVASITVNGDETLPLTVGLSDRRSMFVDPYTGRVVGSDSEVRGIFQAVERWHRSIAIGSGMRSKTGTAVTGVCNLAFLFLVTSGFFLWWPRRWTPRAFAAIALFNRGATGRRRDWNWHHVFGIWAAPVLFVIVVTGTFMSYAWPQQLVARAFGVATAPTGGGERAGRREREGRGDRPRRAHDDASRSGARPRASLDSLIARATPTASWQTIQLRLPQAGARMATASVTYGSTNRPDQRVQLTLDASTAAITQQQRYEDYDPARKARAWVRPIHTGEAWGVLGETVAALASAAAVFLGISGFSLAFRRAVSFARRRNRTAPAAPGENRPGIGRPAVEEEYASS